MVNITLPKEEAKAFSKYLVKIHYDDIAKALRHEPDFGNIRTLEDLAWAARSLIMVQINEG